MHIQWQFLAIKTVLYKRSLIVTRKSISELDQLVDFSSVALISSRRDTTGDLERDFDLRAVAATAAAERLRDPERERDLERDRCFSRLLLRLYTRKKNN